MNKVRFLAIAMSFALLVACAKKGEQKATAFVAKVGSVTITAEDVNRELKGLPEQVQKMFEGPGGADRFVDELVKKETLYQEAKKKGFENNPEYQKKVEDFKKLTLISLMLEKEIEDKAKVDDKDVKDYYEKHKAELTTGNQMRASHILVKTEDEAKKILDQLKKGGDFARIAREKSIDSGSAKNGGDLGFFSKGQMVPEFEKAVFSLKEGEIAGPVKTQFGYHIIKVTGKKEGKVVEFDKVKDLLAQKVAAEKQKEAFDSFLDGLRKSYPVEKNKEAIAALWNTDKEKSDVPGGKTVQPGAKADDKK
ncbi:MAG: peptidylprolyl isomerase [Nitrospirae bacterium]|nr:peptidylprolyl isomerase [Nitrospirota bacterium]